jgi:hypothetical protein
MSRVWGKRPSPSLVISILALFIALGGSAYAATKIGTKNIKNNAITSAKIKNNAVTTAKIKNGAVTGAKINAATLGTVPNATHATTADSAAKATDATHAGSADTAGTATNATNFSRYFTSGLKKASVGESLTVATVGPFTFKGHCIDEGSENFLAEVTVETSAANSFFNSDESEFYEGELEPGEEHLVTEYNAESTGPEWEGWYGYYNEFAAASPDGNFVLQGYSNSGVHAFGADCSFQVSYINAA